MPMCCGGGGRALQVNGGICFESVKQGQVTIQVEPANELFKISWGDGTTGKYIGLATHLYSNSTARFICIEPYNPAAITFLEMETDGLSGQIEPFLASYLNNLVTLYLHNNQLGGSIPPRLGNLASLTVLYLSRNKFSGSIPPELGNLASLTRLYLHTNLLSGSIPPELGNLASLTRLYLHNNQLSGSIPPELGNLASLTQLYLSNNQLSGSIPPELGNLASLTQLYLHTNLLSGSIPPELGNLASLTVIWLSSNNFSQADLSAFVGELWANRATLGANGCDIALGNNNGLDSTAIDQIEGTGAYAGDGLRDAGCTVTY